MSQPQLIKGLTKKEYYRQYRAKNRAKLDKYQDEYRRSHRQYFKEAVKEWRRKNPEQVRLQRAKKRAVIANARTQKHIRLAWLHNWESRVCGICDRLIEGEYQVDHIVPLSKGGEHHAQNLQLAHPFCNRSKFNKLPNKKPVVLLET